MEEELISIIIPTYRVNNNYLDECLNSVCNQTYKNIEIIIVNDGMTKENLELCYQYKEKNSRIKIIGKKNEGVSAARNKGIDESAGDWIVFVDSDDSIENSFCEKMLNSAKTTDSQCVICGYNRVYSNKIEKCIKSESFIINGHEFLNQVLNVQSRIRF